VASTPSEWLFSDVRNLLTVKRTRMKFKRVIFLKYHSANIHLPAKQQEIIPTNVIDA
jgi:hypothetical protein